MPFLSFRGEKMPCKKTKRRHAKRRKPLCENTKRRHAKRRKDALRKDEKTPCEDEKTPCEDEKTTKTLCEKTERRKKKKTKKKTPCEKMNGFIHIQILMCDGNA